MTHANFDTIIVGSGTSAYYIADGLARADHTIAMIDDRPYGGTCALRGCQPKKYLVSNAEAVAMGRHLLGRGIRAGAEPDWTAMQALKSRFLDGRSEAEVTAWQKKGIATYSGRATMTGPDTMVVNGSQLKAKTIVLATGASPRRSGINGSEFITDSDGFLDLPRLPERILFVGGGYISFEFAHVAARCGAKAVTILQRSDRALKSFDPDIVATVIAAGKTQGIQLVLNEAPVSVKKKPDGLHLSGSSGTGYPADLIVEATGRVPNLDVVDNPASMVQTCPDGIRVNEYLQSISNPRVYAVGDCVAQGPMLATVADEQGKTAVDNIINGNHRTVDYTVVPTAVFTIPSIGAVGLSQKAAEKQGIDFRINTGTTTRWPSSMRIGEDHSRYKILIDNATDEIIGAHLARHNAAESINILALAIKFKIKAPQLAEFMWAYPTLVSDLKYMVA